jgi:hypothetical protein
MATDDKVAFYLRHWPLIEEWAALREQAVTELEESFARAVGIVRQHPATPKIIEDESSRYPTIGISLEVPGAESGSVLVALGWSRGELLKPGGNSWPYMGIKIPGATRGQSFYDAVKDLLRCAARDRHWDHSEYGWVWWGYIPLEAGETDLDDYAVRHVEELVVAWKALESGITGNEITGN